MAPSASSATRSQSEVSAAVIEAVGARRGEALRTPAVPEAPRSFEACNAYLLGRHHFHKRAEPTLRRAAELFERAVQFDPTHALAYTAVARCGDPLVGPLRWQSCARRLDRTGPARRRDGAASRTGLGRGARASSIM
jgi:hypothetical protein